MQGLDWLSLFVRWFHVIAGVAWIGASFYFIWLDNSLRTPPEWKQKKGIKGDLWAIHGGGFYEVAKYAYGPQTMPTTLHWFKWEAYTTWLSGFALLVIVYYFGASAYLIDPSVNPLTPQSAILAGLGVIFGGLAVYEIACRSPLAKSPKAFAIFLIALLCFASWLTSTLFSGRGAYIHVGALVGTIMVANVFLNIMPNQRKMVAAVANKGDIDPAWGASAKLRSVHNNYLTLPLLFIMISNHYPMTYQHPQNWLVLIAIMALSAWIRHFFNLKHQGVKKPSILLTGAIGMLLLAIWVSMPSSPASLSNSAQPIAGEDASSQPNASVSGTREGASEAVVVTLIEKHCTSCHSSAPTDDVFRVAPLGVKFDNWADIERYAPQIYQRAAVTKDMPFLNKTGMTIVERQMLADWYEASL